MGLRRIKEKDSLKGRLLRTRVRTKKTPALSPLRYPGSKRRLVAQVEKILSANDLCPSLFIEPFAGGASVALQLLQNGSVERIGLVDYDPLVASFWQTVFFDTKWLVKQIRRIKVTLKQWRAFKSYRGHDVRKQAVACLFLNRTSFSGILAKGAGPIGGATQKSEYSIDCRFNRETIIRRIEQIAVMRDRVAFVWNTSWDKALHRLESSKSNRRFGGSYFYYLDPPFFEKADRLYRFYFNEKQHVDLRDYLLKTKSPWLLSYDAPKEAERLYARARSLKKIGMNYSVHSEGGFRNAQEILISNLPNLSENSANLVLRTSLKSKHKFKQKKKIPTPRGRSKQQISREVENGNH